VLNIGKLKAGAERYYLNSVANGVEDYYLGGEVPGRWMGTGAGLLALAGEVAPDDLVAVMADRDPSSGSRLGTAANRRIVAFDVTMSAPKSVSVLFGLGDPEIAAVVRDAHEESVDAAFGYLDRHAARSRRGRDGVEQVVGDGLVAAGFRHRTSRAGDPHLHTHVLVANTVRRPDGKWRTLDARHFYAHAKTAGYLYEAHLRHLLTERLGVEWRPVVNGTAELAGVPGTVTRLFSRRRGEIEAVLASRGEHSARAAQIATLATRKPKDRNVDGIHLRDRWETEAATVGFSPSALRDLLRRTRPGVVTAADRSTVESRLVSPTGLTAHRSSFDRMEVVRAWCDQLRTGAPVAAIEAWADRFIARHVDVVPLGVESTATIRSTGGKVLSRLATGERWSTHELVALEAHALGHAVARLDTGCAVADHDDLARAFAAHPSLSGEQARVVGDLCRRGNGVDVLTAPAGTGKTFTLDTARDVWERAGYRVIGVAVAGRAADELQAMAGIPSTTIASLRRELDGGRPGVLDARTVLVVDEAGMAGTRTLATLLDHAERAGAKVVLVGDPRQLPEIDAGGLLAALAERLPGVRLATNRRQHEAWEREALTHLRDGDPDVAIDLYRQHGRVVCGTNSDDTRDRLVAHWWAARTAGDDTVMLTSRRSDVADLNRRARRTMTAAGRLTGPPLEVGDTTFQVGDEVVALRNDQRLDVRNGTRGVVVAVDPHDRSLSVERRDGRVVTLPAGYLDAGHVTHGYAFTVHKAQGLTCDQALTLGSDDLYRELGYVAMSRGRKANHLYVVGPAPIDDDAPHAPTLERNAQEILAGGLNTSRSQHLALDAADGVAFHLWSTTDLIAEQRRLRAVLAKAPADRRHDVEALRAGREQLRAELAHIERRRTDLANATRTWRERRRGPDPEQLHLDAQRQTARARLADVDADLDAATASTAARAAFEHGHTDTRRQAAAIAAVLHDRVHRSICQAAHDPPGYLTRTLGPVPGDQPGYQRWLDAATRIETYRLEHGVTDKRSALGPEPHGAVDRLVWQQARVDLEALTTIERPVLAPDRRVTIAPGR
jgi:conjugative relaxase-like TrwC/TraI family protein